MKNPFRSSLFLRLFSTTVAAVVVLFASMYLLTVPFIQGTVERMEESHAQTVLDNIYNEVEKIHRDIETFQTSVLLARKMSLRDIIAVVESRATWLEQRVRRGNLSLAQARRMLLDEIREIHYGNNDYVWAADYRSVLVAHPDPKLNGADFSTRQDSHGNLIVPPMIDIARASGDGYYSYWWRRLGQDEPVEKLSYARHVPFFGLVIGTGVYVDDIAAQLKQRRAAAIDELRQQLRDIRLARTGYVYIFNSRHDTIIHPNANLEGKSLSGMIDPATRQELPAMLTAAAGQPAGVRYKWDRPSDPGNYVHDKISWVRYFPGFDWYIGSSVYVDELNESARTLRNRLLAVFAATLLLSIALVYGFVARLVAPLQQLGATARSIENGDLNVRCPVQRDDEIGVVATAVNGMVDRLRDNIRRLDAKVEERTAEREKADADRKEAEAKLCESEDYNKLLFEESLHPMVVLDPVEGMIDCNPAAVRIYGFSTRDEVIGKTPLDVSTPTQYDGSDSATAASRHVRNALENSIDTFEWRHRRPNGEIWDARVQLMKFNYRGHSLLQFTLDDITEQRKAEEERRQLDQLKSDFLSTVSHELRTPMTSVIGFAKLVRKKLEEVVFPCVATDQKAARAMSQVRGNIDVIVKESERLTLLINDVLDSAKLEAGKIEWDILPLSAAELLTRAATVMTPLAAQKGLALSWAAAGDLPRIAGDENRLLQVLINLISNAIKFTDHGDVRLSAERQGACVRFGVQDSGIGIAPADQENVFEKFRQIGDTLTAKPQGTGLGLSICQQIIRHHGGDIWLESAAGTGSTFYFTIPVTHEGCGDEAGGAEVSATD